MLMKIPEGDCDAGDLAALEGGHSADKVSHLKRKQGKLNFKIPFRRHEKVIKLISFSQWALSKDGGINCSLFELQRSARARPLMPYLKELMN